MIGAARWPRASRSTSPSRTRWRSWWLPYARCRCRARTARCTEHSRPIGEPAIRRSPMSRIAPRIHTDPAQIARLEALLPQLEGETQVELTLHDGRRLLGTVAVKPTVQQYRNDAGDEGSNGQLRLDD